MQLASGPKLLQQQLAANPAERLGTEEEIAEVIGLLATASVTCMQGRNMVVDGGFVIHSLCKAKVFPKISSAE